MRFASRPTMRRRTFPCQSDCATGASEASVGDSTLLRTVCFLVGSSEVPHSLERTLSVLAENEQASAADARELLRKVLELDGMVPTLTSAPWFPERTR